MKGFAKIGEVLEQAIDDLEVNHINLLKNDEKGLSIARVTNDSVAFTSAGASLAFPIIVIPCLATTIVASLSILGTAMADSIIHSMAESRINDFMNKLKIKLNDVVIEDLTSSINFDQMHATSDPLGALAHFLFVSAEVIEHAGPALIKTTANVSVETMKVATGVTSITKFANAISPVASEAVKVVPILGAVFSGLSLTHSAWTFHHSSSLLDNMESLKDHLQTALNNIKYLQTIHVNLDALLSTIYVEDDIVQQII
jgi:hypothetical protein